jgi:hypothetical protein
MTHADLRATLAAHREATMGAATLTMGAILTAAMFDHPEAAESLRGMIRDLAEANTIENHLRATDQLLEMTHKPGWGFGVTR